MTLSKPLPAARSTAPMLSIAWRVSARMSPSPTIVIVPGSRGIWPEQKMNSPARMACE